MFSNEQLARCQSIKFLLSTHIDEAFGVHYHCQTQISYPTYTIKSREELRNDFGKVWQSVTKSILFFTVFDIELRLGNIVHLAFNDNDLSPRINKCQR